MENKILKWVLLFLSYFILFKLANKIFSFSNFAEEHEQKPEPFSSLLLV